MLQRLGLARGGYYVFVPGAEYGPAKRWPVQPFCRAGAAAGAPVLLLGSGKEAALGEEIAALAQRAVCRNLAGKTSLTEAFGLIAAARSVVSNDTGLMHVAAALDVPQVAIFGSSSPLHTPPLSERARVIWLKNDSGYQPPLDCAPCFQRECPLGHLRCLERHHGAAGAPGAVSRRSVFPARPLSDKKKPPARVALKSPRKDVVGFGDYGRQQHAASLAPKFACTDCDSSSRQL